MQHASAVGVLMGLSLDKISNGAGCLFSCQSWQLGFGDLTTAQSGWCLLSASLMGRVPASAQEVIEPHLLTVKVPKFESLQQHCRLPW